MYNLHSYLQSTNIDKEKFKGELSKAYSSFIDATSIAKGEINKDIQIEET